MSYVVLARKYRPQTFADIIGQEGVVETLCNALKAQKIWHASVFAGTRGTGKTSTARIFAKALNCRSLVDGHEPCNVCSSCKDISGGSSVDVVEIDAASNRGIDEIRALRENVKFAPVSSRFKVYIVDEAHQITEQAFNAFLKTLEEPPPYVVFILATTEFQKLPATIVSRCQLFQFRPIPASEIARRLRTIVDREARGVSIDDAALQFVADSAGGAVRDALSLLDQVLAYAREGTIDLTTIRRRLGFTPDELIHSFVKTVASGNLLEIIECVDSLYAQGVDLVQFSRELVALWRDMLAVSVGAGDPRIRNAEAVRSLASRFTISKLIAGLQMLLRLADDVRRSEVPKIVFELYSVRLTKNYVELDQLAPMLEGGGIVAGGRAGDVVTSACSAPDAPGTGTRPQTAAAPATPAAVPSPETAPARGAPATIPPEQPSSANRGTGAVVSPCAADQDPLDIPEDVWERLKDALRADEPMLFSFLINSTGILRADRLVLQLPNKYMINVAKQYTRDIERYVTKYLKRTLQVSFELKPAGSSVVIGESPEHSRKESPGEKMVTVPLAGQPKKDPVVERIRKKFGGEFVEPGAATASSPKPGREEPRP